MHEGTGAAAGPVIVLRDVVVLLGRFPALAGLSLAVSEGELVVVRGPNGAGKTTLLRTCAGLTRIVAGQAQVLARDLRVDARGVRRSIAMLGHAGFLYEDLTVEDNIRFAVRAAGAPTDGVEDALVRFGLDGRLRATPVGACSAGQRRRTSLAALVARHPPLWLLDEPHAGLDAQSRDLLDETVRAAVAAGATVLLASHDEERAEALATRTVHVNGGYVTHDSGTRQ